MKMEKESGGRAAVSMVMGIVSMVGCCVPLLPVGLALAAIIVGIGSMVKNDGSRGMAITGVVCGGLGLVMGLISLYVWGVAIAASMMPRPM
ncbi:hypothetical protein D3Z51_06250 [Clostridiaceae bacterium]|nr:hypothetical protein [Clostridiaceae bacterium]RKI17351.1 hypothetical protein D7V81_02315 [bacterium 1XD21-70]